MGRRRGRSGNKPAHIDVLELKRLPPKKTAEKVEVSPVIVAAVRVPRKVQVHTTTSQVLSRDLDETGQLFLEVSDAVNINIFMRR